MMSLDHRHGIYLIVGIPLVIATAPLLIELFVTTLAAMMSPSKRTPRALGLPALGRLIVLVPSHNEELAIGRCIESVTASAGRRDDILVIAHNCVDSTAENARATGAMVSVLNDPD